MRTPGRSFCPLVIRQPRLGTFSPSSRMAAVSAPISSIEWSGRCRVPFRIAVSYSAFSFFLLFRFRLCLLLPAEEAEHLVPLGQKVRRQGLFLRFTELQHGWQTSLFPVPSMVLKCQNAEKIPVPLVLLSNAVTAAGSCLRLLYLTGILLFSITFLVQTI